MRKEVLWAIIAGISFGVIIAFGAWRVNLGLKKIQENVVLPSPTSQSKSNDENLKLTINKPENESVVTNDKIKISGITKPDSWVVLGSNESDYVTKTNSDGIFEHEVDLENGVNQLNLITIDLERKSQSENEITIVYSPLFEEREETKVASESGSTIRDRVAAKVDNLIFNPKAYLGVVTDISEETIQLKSEDGEIKQIEVNEDNLTVTKDTGKKVSTVKFADIAIGDFIVAMGYQNEKKVLEAQRILITPQVEKLKLEVEYGLAKEIVPTITNTKNISVFSIENGESKKIKLSNIEDGQNIIYIKDRTIFTFQKE